MAEKLLSGAHQVKIGNYLLGDTLGSGTFGKVKGKNQHGIHPAFEHSTGILTGWFRKWVKDLSAVIHTILLCRKAHNFLLSNCIMSQQFNSA